MKTKEKIKEILEYILKIDIKSYEETNGFLTCINNKIKITLELRNQYAPVIFINEEKFDYCFFEEVYKRTSWDKKYINLISDYYYKIQSHIEQKETKEINKGFTEKINEVYKLFF